MDEFISKKAALDLCKKFLPSFKGSLLEQSIKSLPSIVRCKECVEYKEWGDGKICMRYGSYFGNAKPDDFCSYGRRR